MPDDRPGAYKWSDRLMSADEILKIAEVFTGLGINKIRLTGGEPLVRKDAADIISRLAALPVKLTMTTNGVLLDEYADILMKSGVKSLNVSLDSMDRDTFKRIAQRDQLDRVVRNIDLMISKGFHLKLNMVVMKGVNEHEIPAFIALTRNENLHVRFIEYMPFTDNGWDKSKVVSEEDVLKWAAAYGDFEKLSDELNATARAWRAVNHIGTFAVISTMTHPFCSSCNRLRLTADGKMKNCLFSSDETDLLSALRQGDDLEFLIRTNILGKAEARGGQLLGSLEEILPDQIQNRTMITIGG